MSEDGRVRTRLLAVLTFLATVAAMKYAYPVLMPLAVALIVVAAAWPIQPWLERFVPRWLAYVGTAAVLLAALAAFLFATYLAAAQVATVFSRDWERFQQVFGAAADLFERLGIDVSGEAAYERATAATQAALARIYNMLAYTGGVAALVIFALPEVRASRTKLFVELRSGPRREVFAAVEEVAAKIRSYLAVTSALSVLTGLACYLFTFAVGLDLAVVWGVSNFLLNYIPIVGNIIGVLPPVIYAAMQFQDSTMPALVLGGLTVIHIVVSYLVAPLLQQRSLSLSPIAILLALAFWGWLWGVAGALIAVPATAALAIACDHFERTRWIALLLSTPFGTRDAG